MITIRFEGMREVQDMLATAGKQAKFATSLALNDLAFMIRDKEIETMQQVFKNPMPRTVNNIRVRKATAQNLTATISFNQIWDWDEYMVPEIEGGSRPMKRSEKAFGHYYVPGAGAQLDQYGNIKGSQIQQIMSYLQKFGESGFKMNRTASRQTALGKGMNDYFMITQTTNGLKPGVYMRVDKGQGQMIYARAMANKPRGVKKAEMRAKLRGQLERGVVPVLVFVNRPPTYRKRFPFYEVSNQVVADNAQRVVKERVMQVILTAT